MQTRSKSPAADFPALDPARVIVRAATVVRQAHEAEASAPSMRIVDAADEDTNGALVRGRWLPPAPADLQSPSHWQRARVHLENSNIPPRFRDADLRRVCPAIAAESGSETTYGHTVEKLLALLHHPALLALVGTPGTGKTWMSCGLVKEFCRAARSARFLSSLKDYFSELRATFTEGAGVSQAQVERRYRRPDLLGIDEICERPGTQFETEEFDRLVNDRYARDRATVLVTNLTPDALEDRLGSRIADRFRDRKDGSGGVIVCDWPSLRGRAWK
jgi:DNA replication protein DnaC